MFLIPPSTRRKLLKPFQRTGLYRWLLFRHIDAKDRKNGISSDLPPAEQRYRVNGAPDLESFIVIGQRCVGDINSSLSKIGRDLKSFSSILDFGCGCGRTLIHLQRLAPAVQIHGADIDVKAIEWCKQHLSFASFAVTKPAPPTDYASDSFEFIYAISVFTHLNEDYQFAWLRELWRIAKPGGVVMLTVDSSRALEQGFVFEQSYEKGLFPTWYQNAYHSKEYVVDKYSSYFEVVDYLPQSMNGHQDVVMLQKPNTWIPLSSNELKVKS